MREMLDAAKLAGMSAKGLAAGKKLLYKYRDMWRINLRKDDYVDLAPLTSVKVVALHNISPQHIYVVENTSICCGEHSKSVIHNIS